MSEYTITNEASVTASATSTGSSGATMLATDAIPVFNTAIGKLSQSTVGSVSAMNAVQSISSSTTAGFVTVAPYGISIITAAATGGVAIMPAPPSAGLSKIIAMAATSTSTGFQVICGSSSVAIFTTGTSTNTIVPRLQVLFGQNSAYIDMMSLSTSAWSITGFSAGAGAIAFTTSTST